MNTARSPNRSAYNALRHRSSTTAWLTPELARVLAAAGCWGFSYSSFLLLPTFLEQRFAAGPETIGIVVGAFGMAVLTFTPLAGRWVDKYKRSRCIAGGAALMSAASLAYTAIDSMGPALIALRAAQGLSYAVVLVAVGTLVADSVPPNRLSQALGLSGASMLVMNAVGPAVVEPLSLALGWEAAFIVSAIAAAAAVILALGIEESPHVATDATERPASLMALLSTPLGSHYALVMTLCGAAFGSVLTFEQSYARGLGREYVGGFYITFAAGALFMRLFFGSMPDRLGRHRVGWVSCSVYAAAIAALAIPAPGWLEAFGLLFGLSHGLLYPSINAIAVTAVARGERGRIMAIFTGAFNVGVWAGATLLGPVASHFGYPTVFALTAVIALAAAIVFRNSTALGAAVTPSPAGRCATPDFQTR